MLMFINNKLISVINYLGPSHGSHTQSRSDIVKTSIFYIEHQGQFRAWGYQT